MFLLLFLSNISHFGIVMSECVCVCVRVWGRGKGDTRSDPIMRNGEEPTKLINLQLADH